MKYTKKKNNLIDNKLTFEGVSYAPASLFSKIYLCPFVHPSVLLLPINHKNLLIFLFVAVP